MTPAVPIPRQRTRRLRPALVRAALATTVLAAAAGADGAVVADGPQADGGSTWAADAGRRAAEASSVPGPVREPQPVAARHSPDALLAEAMRPLLAASGPTRLSVAVLDPANGRTARFGAERFDTASVVKVNIVAALLLRARDEGRELTDAEREDAAAAIQASDNEATHRLWARLGGEGGLDAANRRLGLRATTGGGEGHWGLTQTTSADQLILLEQIFTESSASALAAEDRAYLRALMGSVIDEQRWGVSAAGAGTGGAELKNGWLPRSGTGLWDVNSIGRVRVDGRTYLVAVLSDGHATDAEGIALVEAAARAAVAAIGARPAA